MAKVTKKVAKKVKEVKAKVITAASIVLGLLAMKNVPCDADIIAAVQGGVEVTKFDKTQLAWYKYQFRQGRWNDGEAQVINQAVPAKVAETPKTKAVKKGAKKAKPVEVNEEEEGTEE